MRAPDDKDELRRLIDLRALDGPDHSARERDVGRGQVEAGRLLDGLLDVEACELGRIRFLHAGLQGLHARGVGDGQSGRGFGGEDQRSFGRDALEVEGGRGQGDHAEEGGGGRTHHDSLGRTGVPYNP